MQKTRIGIYGGTFGPVHLGHMHAAMQFLSCCALNRLYIIPTAIPPHKERSTDDTPIQRLDMLRLAFSAEGFSDDRICISDYEQQRGGKSYTIHTLQHFQGDNVQLYLLCGTDMFLTLEDWYRGDEILSSTNICCLMREDDPSKCAQVMQMAEHYQGTYQTEVIIPKHTPYPVSSTEVRRRIAQNQSTDGLLHPTVRDYIDCHRLYKNTMTE